LKLAIALYKRLKRDPETSKKGVKSNSGTRKEGSNLYLLSNRGSFKPNYFSNRNQSLNPYHRDKAKTNPYLSVLRRKKTLPGLK